MVNEKLNIVEIDRKSFIHESLKVGHIRLFIGKYISLKLYNNIHGFFQKFQPCFVFWNNFIDNCLQIETMILRTFNYNLFF